jgi:hypothetical protein
MAETLNGIYPDMDHLTPTEMCEHTDAYATHVGGFYCPTCAKAMDYTELVKDKLPSDMETTTPDREIFPISRRQYFARLRAAG